jgi:hypothetical protein
MKRRMSADVRKVNYITNSKKKGKNQLFLTKKPYIIEK